MTDFHGAKLAILCRDRIVAILRDDTPSIPWPGQWDLPGGGREGDETPEACVLRELHEELGLILTPADLHWSIDSLTGANDRIWFFVSEQPEFDPETVCFGDEGQEWRMVDIDWFLTHPKVIPRHGERLKTYLDIRENITARPTHTGVSNE